MIRILYTISTLANEGPVNQLYNIVKNIDKERFDIRILTLTKEGKNTRIYDFLKEGIEIDCLDIPHKKYHFYKNKFFTRIKAIEPDIVHSHCFRADYFNSHIKKYFPKIRTISTVHSVTNEEYLYNYGRIIGNILTMNNINIFKGIDYLVACSRTIKNNFKEKYNIDTYLINNSADEDKFNVKENKSKSFYREKLNLGKDKITYIYVGSLTKRKNVRYLVDAFNAIDERFQLLVLGDGNLKEELMKESSSNVLFLGRKDNVRDYLMASDVFVSASFSEGMPTAVLEAMACGLPLLLSDIPQHQEIIDRNPFVGDLFSLADREDLVNKIKAYSSKDIIEKKSKASADTFTRYFTSKRMAEEYTKLYEEIIKGRY